MIASRGAVLALIAGGLALPACWRAQPVPVLEPADEPPEPPPNPARRADCPPPPWVRAAAETPDSGELAGSVVDAACEPVAGAVVVARLFGKHPLYAQHTGEDGRFVLGDLAPGDYTISVYFGASRLERGGVIIEAGVVEHVQLVLPPPAEAPPLTSDPAP